jgi:acetyl-CoA carboxylase biotin carboxyl carrier protein
MAKDSSFNEDLVRQLAAILKDTDLTEIEYEVEGCRIKVARQVQMASVAASLPVAPLVSGGQPSKPAPVVSLEVISSSADLSSHPGALKSPMVGNVYLSSSPGAEPFVKVGDKISKGQNILIIEAMKVMNPIKSPIDGIMKQVLVHNGEPVEYDQVLVIIE